MSDPFTVTSDTVVVLPTCRGYSIPRQSMRVDWIIVHDEKERPIDIPQGDANDYLFSPGFVRSIVAPDPGLYGAKTSAIRQAGLDVAYDEGYKYILTVDDDCSLPETWAASHVQALGGRVPVSNNTMPGFVIRGQPADYTAPVAISHGLWSGILDYPAWYQIANDIKPVIVLDKGWDKISAPFPMCGMNVGFTRRILPAVYFQHTFTRHDDIFAGWIAQRVAELHGFGFVNGGAVVKHTRESNAQANLIKENPGDIVNASLLSTVRQFTTPGLSPAYTYIDLVNSLYDTPIRDYDSLRLFVQMLDSMLLWSRRRLL